MKMANTAKKSAMHSKRSRPVLTLTCPFCEKDVHKLFSSRQGLGSHIYRVHPQEFSPGVASRVPQQSPPTHAGNAHLDVRETRNEREQALDRLAATPFITKSETLSSKEHLEEAHKLLCEEQADIAAKLQAVAVALAAWS